MQTIKKLITKLANKENALKLFFLIIFTLTSQIILAQPSNDDFANAINITSLINNCSADAEYTTTGATPDRNGGSEWNNPGAKFNVWFSFIASANGQIKITVDINGVKGNQRFSQVALWEADGLTEIRSENWYTPLDDINLGHVGLTPGATYYISVDTHATNTRGTFTLCLSDVLDYDFYEGAIEVNAFMNGCSPDAAYDTRGASHDRNMASEWTVGGPRNNRWFWFNAPATGDIHIEVKRGGGAGNPLGTQRFAQLALWEADGITELASDRYYSQYSDIDVNYMGLTPGVRYYISVDAYASAGSFTLCLNDQVDYDLYEGAIDVTTLINGCSIDAEYNTQGASPDLNPASNWLAGSPTANRWFRFIAPDTGQLLVTVDIVGIKGTQTRTLVAVWEADGTTEVSSTLFTFNTEDVVLGAPSLTPGNIYYISVDSATTSYLGSFTLCLAMDNDSDGVGNAMDLDNDNDGILDSVEGAADPDGDLLPNSLDLDSDGDGLPDNVEAQTTATYLPPNNDDVATYLANNGVNSAYLGGLIPVNTDNTDTPDYLDTDSDNEGGNDTIEGAIVLSGNDVDNDGLDDATDADTTGYADPGGIIDNPLTNIVLPDVDNDASSGGDVDFRDTTDNRPDHDNDGIVDVVDLDDDNDGILDCDESSDSVNSQFFWAFNNPSGTFNMDVINDPRITNWALTSTSTLSISGLGFSTPNSNLQLNSISSVDFADAFSNDQYVEVSFTTGNISTFVLNNIQSVWIQPNIGDSYRSTAMYSSGAFTSWEILSNNVLHSNTGAGTNFFDHQVRSTIPLLANTEYRFRFYIYSQIDDSAQNWSSFDDISFSISACQLQDSDGDTVPNHLDLDAENDGIYDAVEAGHGQAHTNGFVNGAVGTDGVPDTVQASPNSGMVNYTLAESVDDTDAIPNFLDLDSDGDGLPDNVEAQTTIGYVSPNGDDAATYTTNNGVNSAYLVMGGLNPTNTDGTDNPDYLDTDSDNEGGNDRSEARIPLAGSDADNDGLDDASDTTGDYSDPGGTIDDPLTVTIILPDVDNDASTGGNVDFRDATDDRPDNDLDGIVDEEDFDDDNDGILDSDEGCGNLILNGSFEQQDFTDAAIFPGGFAGPNGTFIGTTYNTNTLAGWSYTQNLDGWVGSALHAPAYHGVQYLDVVGNNNVTGGVSNELSQIINTVPGKTYTFSFYWGEDRGHAPPEVVTLMARIIDSNNAVIIDRTLTTNSVGPIGGLIGPNNWFYHEETFVATTAQTTVWFTATPPGAGDTSAGAALDLVSVTLSSAAECADTDNDGVIDAFDLDSDNDGIYDAVEASHGQAHTNGMVNGTVGTDGVPDAVQSSPNGETTNYTLAESVDDTDAIPNFLDLDSDGDGLPDNVEAQTTIGYVSPNGDDAATYTTNNGVNSAYLGGLLPENTDLADNPDYLDLDSDNDSTDDTTEAVFALLRIDNDQDGLDRRIDSNDNVAYDDANGNIDTPSLLPDIDGDVLTGGDVDYRDNTDDRADNDNDGIVDVVDLDDDNDGIPDNKECLKPRFDTSMGLSTGSNDRNWNVEWISGPLDYAPAAISGIVPAVVVGRLGALSWTAAPVGTGSDWISHPFNTAIGGIGNHIDADLDGVPFERPFLAPPSGPTGDFVLLRFTNTFSLPVGLAATFYLNFDMAADNGTLANNIHLPVQVFVNGVLQTTPLVDFNVLTNVNLASNWVDGDNIVEIVVSSGPPIGGLLITNTTSLFDNCDFDNDGVPNHLDLDSDNDGILDVVEAGHGQAQTDGVIDGLPVAFGANGLFNAIEDIDTSSAVTTYTLAESADDTDTIPNFLDLDSDGDGLPDNVEAQTTIGYLSPAADDATTYAVNRGVNSAYLIFGGLDPENTDNTDNPDYLDTDSDNEGGDDTLEAGITLSGNDIDNDGLDDATDADTTSYADPGGTIDDPLSGAIILPDADSDATTGGDVDFRDALVIVDIDSDNDGIIDSIEDLNTDGDNDPSTDPTNSDNDSYPDYLDIDSDNDGIPDNVEAQRPIDYIPPSGQDTNNNGLDDAYEANGDVGLQPVNRDGVDFPDYLDVDSDNDTIPDAIEGHDHNHDGIADVLFIGSDKDNDGLDDGYEGSEAIDVDVNDEINDPMTDLPNTDGDPEPDYRDIDDDGDTILTIDEDTNNDGDYINDDFDNDGSPDYLDVDQPIVIEEVEVFNVVTNNGDGVHDFLIITGLDIRPNNTLQIYNRWGVLVYSTTSYDTKGNRFDGTSQARSTVGQGEKLPSGTYFYILNYENQDGEHKSVSGHLYLN